MGKSTILNFLLISTLETDNEYRQTVGNSSYQFEAEYHSIPALSQLAEKRGLSTNSRGWLRDLVHEIPIDYAQGAGKLQHHLKNMSEKKEGAMEIGLLPSFTHDASTADVIHLRYGAQFHIVEVRNSFICLF